MKNAIIVLVLFSIFLSNPSGITAENNSFEKKPRNALRQEVREEKKEFLDKKKEMLKNKQEITTWKNKAAKIIEGEIKTISANTLTVSKNNQSFTVNISEKTNLRRKFWGNSSLPEFSVGNKVNIWGTWTDETKTAIDAKFIRNLSVVKKTGVFGGSIVSLGQNSLVLSMPKHPNQTVTINADTKIKKRNNTPINFSDLKTGDKLRIKGMWDVLHNTIDEVKEIVDFTTML